MDCFLKDGSVLDFLEATFDPVPKLAPMKTGAYHYLLVSVSASCHIRTLKID
jgi:hypothetical protein